MNSFRHFVAKLNISMKVFPPEMIMTRRGVEDCCCCSWPDWQWNTPLQVSWSHWTWSVITSYEMKSPQDNKHSYASLRLPCQQTHAEYYSFVCHFVLKLPFLLRTSYFSSSSSSGWWLLISILWRKRVPCRNWLWCLSSSVISLNTRWIIFHFLAW